MSMPGFSAEAATLGRDGRVWFAQRAEGTPERGVAPQATARSTGGFSGSCQRYGDVTCCVLCYYDNCYWWCSAPPRLPTGF